MAITDITREIISDCIARLSRGDACAAFDLASQVIAHADSKDIELNLAIVEALALCSKQAGCAPAENFLSGEWDSMRTILRKRWARSGMV